MLDRRCFLSSTAMSLLLTVPATTWAGLARFKSARVIIDNDFAGDPDGLFQLAHHLLSPSVDVPLIVSSHLPTNFGGPVSASDGVKKAQQVLDIIKRGPLPHLVGGAELPILSRNQWKATPATTAIIREAMREDAREPLFYAAGASLTELAIAWLSEPKIGKRIKLVWIGGNEHPGLAYPPPGPAEPEFNFSVDPVAAQVIFNESDIEIWQVPRDVYRQFLMSTAEISDLAKRCPIGRFLGKQLDEMEAALAKIPDFPAMPISDVYVLGDSPLVTLTALMTPIQPDPSSSRYMLKPTPELLADGTYRDRADTRSMRVYTMVDAGLTFRDMISRFKASGQSR
ncbi:nucleoside hydrolase [Novosphingobium flavum]|uniref:Nucleoside hydrolase n=2 Tax=Novosphingobium aerophilum TaxID=2839843 RepID=A0A7X1F9P9_9SPHN|nr:nucleoside hydrolase [Novosphingobium aerophilum]MBC2652936.1 nucleoside hydrolase [Novosphingobium aerophilum]MBC2662016.1 nucleoside hydrolase [Novosphingobium aerophilum]